MTSFARRGLAKLKARLMVPGSTTEFILSTSITLSVNLSKDTNPNPGKSCYEPGQRPKIWPFHRLPIRERGEIGEIWEIGKIREICLQKRRQGLNTCWLTKLLYQFMI